MKRFAVTFTAAAMTVICTVSSAFASGEISPVQTQSTQAEQSVSTDYILENSVINYYGMNRFLNKGTPENLSVTDNISKEIDGRTYAELSWLMSCFGMKYSWDNKNSVLTVIDGGKRARFNCVDFSYMTDDADQGFFYNEQTFVPLDKLCSQLNYYFFHCNDFWAVSETVDLEKCITDEIYTEIVDKNKTVLVHYDFETEKPSKLSSATWGGASEGSFVSACEISEDEGNGILKAGAITVGYGGVYLPGIPFDRNSQINLSFDIKASKDYKNSTPKIMFLAFNGDSFVTYINEATVVPSSEQWTHVTSKIDVSSLPENAQDIKLMFGTALKGDSKYAAGYVMYDNIEVAAYPKTESKKAEVSPLIRADNHVNWYVLGDTVTMTPTNKIDSSLYEQIKVEIYDSFNQLVNSEKVRTDSFNGGYKWKPSKPGYYEYQFYTVDKSGNESELNEFYDIRHPQKNEKVRFYVKRQGIVVVKSETKPMSERNDHLAVSITPNSILNPANSNGHKNGDRWDEIEIANLVGFQKVRFHALQPNNYAWRTEAKANMYRGDFRFGEFDSAINEAHQYGFDLVLNILGMPAYSVPYRGVYTTKEGGDVGNYEPNDMAAWSAYVEQIVKRYKNICNKWEIWNEPHVYGGSIFWYGNVEAYARIQKTGYDVVKKYQPGDSSMVTLGGIGARRYVPFYRELLDIDGAYGTYDVLAMHGWDLDPWTYNNIAEEKGFEPKQYVTTEGHHNLRRSDSEYIKNDEKEEAIRGIGEFLKDFKYGALFTTMFSIGESNDSEYVKYFNSQGVYGVGQECGIYRKYPFETPRFATAALHTFFENMGKTYEYKDEYLLENKKQNAVRMNNDGEEQLIVWNVGGSKAKNHNLSKQIVNCANDGFRIVDWEGNEVDVSDRDNIVIKPETMYFVYGLDSDKLDKLESGKGEKPYLGDVLYNNTEKSKLAGTERKESVVAIGETEPLFDKTTFALNDSINYVSDDWKWVSAEGADKGDFKAKYALSVSEDGLYLVVKAQDTADDANAESADKMELKDSVQFAFDTVGDRSENGYMECQFGEVNGNTVVYKQKAPYIGGDLIADFTPEGTVITKASAYRKSENGETTYMLYLPNSEIYPYTQDVNNAFNFSVLVNQNNGSGKLGYLEWGGGIGKEKNPKKYGTVYLGKKAFDESGEYFRPLDLGNDKPLFDLQTLEYNSDIYWITDRINWVECTEGAQQGDFDAKFAVSVTDEGLYIAAEVTDDDINTDADRNDVMWSYDSIQFAIDPTAGEFVDNRIECQFGKTSFGGVTLYKQCAPEPSGDNPPKQYTRKETVITNGIRSINAEGNKITYKIFLPIDEIYPFKPSDNDCMKFSILFNQNKNSERIGYLEWSSGIGAQKSAKQYGIISYK